MKIGSKVKVVKIEKDPGLWWLLLGKKGHIVNIIPKVEYPIAVQFNKKHVVYFKREELAVIED
jgi:hypothetical protein